MSPYTGSSIAVWIFMFACVWVIVAMVALFVVVLRVRGTHKSMGSGGQRGGRGGKRSDRSGTRQKKKKKYGPSSGVDRLKRLLPQLRDLGADYKPSYKSAYIPKKTGGVRELSVPDRTTKQLQRALYHQLFSKYKIHEAATGFARGRSIVDNASRHVGQEVVVKLDIRDFFPNTHRDRILRYFLSTGWDDPAAKLLTRLVVYKQGLPQGAPTSPVLSNILNKSMDIGLFELAEAHGAQYSRYADDITYSFRKYNRDLIHSLLQRTGVTLKRYGYQLNARKKRVIRRHRRQQVTGLVVNDKVSLPRSRRRWLRAIQHRYRQGQKPSVSDAEYQGWISLLQMVSPDSPLLEEHRRLSADGIFMAVNIASQSSAEPGMAQSDSKSGHRELQLPQRSSQVMHDPGGANRGEDRGAGVSDLVEPSPAIDPSSVETSPLEKVKSNAPIQSESVAEQSAVPIVEPAGDTEDEIFHEQRLVDHIQRLKNARAYSAEKKELEQQIAGSRHTVHVILESSKRTFSFRLPDAYQKGRTAIGRLSDGTAVELYFQNDLVDVVELARFPLEGEVTLEVIQWNSTFKRIEATVSGGLFH